MGILVVSTDFVGKYKVSFNTFQSAEFDIFIAQYETQYLYDLLGKTLADLFIASVVSHVPVGAAYLAIYNTIEETIGVNVERNEGMKAMVLGFLYYEWMRKSPIKSTITGAVTNANENSTLTFNPFGLTTRYNDSVASYDLIQYYINVNSTDYPDYLGSKKEYALPF